MVRNVLPWAAATACLAFLSGCSGLIERPQRPAWRAQAENVCLAQKLVRVSAYVQPAHAINGPSICGAEHPFKVTALSQGAVSITGTQTYGCPMVAALDRWLEEVVQPVANARFGQPVVALTSVGSFSCRPANNVPGANLSEHSFANASDIGGFKLADGRQIVIARDWTRGGEEEKAFLRETIAGACEIFTTVLGPGYNALHYNHFHLDLAQHGNTSTGPRRICKPKPGPQLAPQPRDSRPDAPDIETDEDLEVAQHRAPAQPQNRALAMQSQGMQSQGSQSQGMGTLDASAPPRIAAQQPRSPYNPNALAPPAPIGAPRNLGLAATPRAAAPRPSATMREDGVFVPEGNPADWDATSTISRTHR